MPALPRSPPPERVIAKPATHFCEKCGKDNAPYGLAPTIAGLPAAERVKMTRWFCHEHRPKPKTK